MGDGSPLSHSPPPELRLCDACEGVMGPWRGNFAPAQACVRQLAKEGQGMRDKVEDFVCISQKRAISWSLHPFKNYNAKRRKKVLCEEAVLDVAFPVEAGMATSLETGVSVETPLRDGLNAVQ